MASSIDLSTSEKASYSVVTVAGKIDSDTSPQFTKVLSGLVASGKTKIVIDLSAVTFMSSAGIGASVKILNDCRSKKGDLRIAGIQSEVKKVFELLGFAAAFTFFANVATAAK